MKDKKTFGSFIKQKRIEKNYSQKDLAELLFVTESAVSKWERGVTYPDITLISEDAVMQYDYFETAELLEGKIRNNIGYLNNIISGDTDFRSAQTGYSMRDLANAYDSLLKNL